MMRLLTRVFAAGLAFTVNVEVKAGVKVPEGCSLEQVTCAWHVDSLEVVRFGGATELRMAKGSSVVRLTDQRLRLIRGTAGFAPEGKLEVETLYGVLRASKGEFVVEAEDGIVRAYNLDGDLYYQPRGEETFHSLPAGFSVFMTPVGKSGLAMTGFPKPIELKPMIDRWGKLHREREKDLLRTKLTHFMSDWRQAVEVVGPWYRTVIEREIASQKAEAERIARERARREAEDGIFRRMFRARIFGE